VIVRLKVLVPTPQVALAVSVWAPSVVLAGITTLALKAPVELAVAVVSSVESSLIGMLAPAVNELPDTVIVSP
jgi:hypothetical protein